MNQQTKLGLIATAGVILVIASACGDSKTNQPVSQTSVPVAAPVSSTSCSPSDLNNLAGLTGTHTVASAAFNESTGEYKVFISGDQSGAPRTFHQRCVQQQRWDGDGAQIQFNGDKVILLIGEDFDLVFNGQAGQINYRPYYYLTSTPSYISPITIIDYGYSNPRVFVNNPPIVINNYRTTYQQRQNVRRSSGYTQTAPVTPVAPRRNTPAYVPTTPANKVAPPTTVAPTTQPADTQGSRRSTGGGFGFSVNQGTNSRKSTPVYTAPPVRQSTPATSTFRSTPSGSSYRSTPRSAGGIGSSRSGFSSSGSSRRR